MKKVIFATAGLVLTGGIITMSYINNDQPTEEPTTVTASAQSEKPAETEAPVTPPTERTVDTSGEYPWNFLDKTNIKAEIDGGGQVYLMSDAEALESQALAFLGNPVGDNVEETYASYGGHFELFSADLREYYLMDADYFDKLGEAATALINNDPDTATVKLQEAQSLRTN